MEDKEALDAGAVVGELPDAVEDLFLVAGDHLLRVAVGVRADLVDDRGLQVQEDGPAQTELVSMNNSKKHF